MRMAITSMGSYSGANNNNNNNGMETSSSDLVAMLHGPCSNVGQLQVAAPALLEDAVAITGQKRPYSCYDGPTVEDGDGDGDEAELSPVEKKRRLTFEQVRSLERNFEMENKLEPERKMQLAKELGLRPRQVAVWFQNRRARWKTKQLERDYETLAADYERLKADYEQVLGEKKQLKAEVQRLSSGNTDDDVKLLQQEPACRSRESEFLSRQHNARSSPTVDVSLAHHRFKDDVTASGSSSDVLDADSPRTTDSSSCGGGGRHRESEHHVIDASHSPESLNSLLGEDPGAILQPLTMSKLEDHGPASDGFHDEFVDQSCNYLLLQLDEQSVLPWWDWP